MSMRHPRNVLHLVLEPSHSKNGRHSFVFWACSAWLTFCSCFHFVTCGSLWATKLPAITAFPCGLPEDLKAIAILPTVSDGSVDSDNSSRLTRHPLITPIYSIDFSWGEISPSGFRCKQLEHLRRDFKLGSWWMRLLAEFGYVSIASQSKTGLRFVIASSPRQGGMMPFNNPEEDADCWSR